jgi:nickel-dependent lactate racemase
VEESVERSETVVAGRGNPNLDIDLEEAKAIIAEGTPDELVADKRVLVLTPDATRTCPLPRMISAVKEVVGDKAKRLDFMVALGSHHPLGDDQILNLYGISPERKGREFGDSSFLNHRWDLPETLSKIGTIPEGEIERITGGLFREAVDVDINRRIFDYDLLLILGPVFPHEVVGISGGNKYLFPGISGGDFLHFFHWLGAVISCWKIIGRKDTPVREVVNRATQMVTVPRHCICMVVGHGAAGEKADSLADEAQRSGRLAGLFAGTPEEAWSRAADLSQQMHIRYKDEPYHTVLGAAPKMYDELWVGGKVMYKLEPVVADGGRLIIYAPHLKEISSTWGRYLEQVGYHVAEYFLKQWDRFKDVPRGVLAHSAHVKGLGSYENGVEKPRIEVILATGIPEQMCRKLDLGYMDPANVRIEEYQNREAEGILFVDHAGEVLHRVKGEQ